MLLRWISFPRSNKSFFQASQSTNIYHNSSITFQTSFACRGCGKPRTQRRIPGKKRLSRTFIGCQHRSLTQRRRFTSQPFSSLLTCPYKWFKRASLKPSWYQLICCDKPNVIYMMSSIWASPQSHRVTLHLQPCNTLWIVVYFLDESSNVAIFLRYTYTFSTTRWGCILCRWILLNNWVYKAFIV